MPAALAHVRLAPGEVRVEEEGRTVEDSLLLDVYTALHRRDTTALRVEFPGSRGDPAVAHLLLPPGAGPHPAVVVFPILGGSHVVSEMLAKALVGRGFAAARLERRPLGLETARHPGELADTLAAAVRDGRRLVDWLETRPEVDPDRVAAAGVSLGGILACLLLAVDDRVRGGLLMLAGGGLAEIVYDSRERSLRAFRDRLLERERIRTRGEFLTWSRPALELADPLRYAAAVDPASVLLVSGRFDRVIPTARTEALWRALGRPRWLRVPTGHYQLLPFFWHAVARGADHLDRVFRAGANPPEVIPPT